MPASHHRQPARRQSVRNNKPTPITTLSEADKQHLLNDKFTVVNKVLDIPGPVLGRLLGGKSMDAMADPGQPFQETDVVMGRPLPFRRLIFAARSKNYCLVYFEHGGIAYGTAVALYRLSDPNVVPVWHARMRESGPSKTLSSLQSEISKGLYF